MLIAVRDVVPELRTLITRHELKKKIGIPSALSYTSFRNAWTIVSILPYQLKGDIVVA